MEKIITCQAYSLYAQVELFDTESPDFPEWETDSGVVSVTRNCLAVKVAGDVQVDIEVYKGNATSVANMQKCFSGNINVGNDGLSVGNYIACDIAKIEWPSEKTLVSVYLDNLNNAKKVFFVLESNM